MNIPRLLPLVLLVGLLASCRVVNTHVVKVTSTPVVDATSDVVLKTTTGNVSLSAPQLSPAAREMLQGVRPFQCVAITTSEPFDMNHRDVRFTDFRLKRLVEGDRECRKVKVTPRISVD